MWRYKARTFWVPCQIPDWGFPSGILLLQRVPVEAQNQKFPGYYTTLRNTIYKITVKNIFNVGADVPNGNPDGKQPNYYMQVSVDVNPWVLKAYEIDLK